MTFQSSDPTNQPEVLPTFREIIESFSPGHSWVGSEWCERQDNIKITLANSGQAGSCFQQLNNN